MVEQALEKVEKEIEATTEKVVENTEKALGNVEEKVKKIVEKVEKVVSDDKKTDDKPKETKTIKEDKKTDDKPKETKTIKEDKKEEKLIYDLYDINEVTISDPGLKNVINLNYSLVIKSHGRSRVRFGKANVNIIERLVNTVSVPGHRGKKHKIITRWATGKYNKNTKQVLEAFRIIKEKTKKNPIQVLVDAIEKGSPRDEVTIIQYGGARYPQAVDSSPLRRISLALRNIVHGAYDKSFRKRKAFSQSLAEEIMLTSNESGDSVAFTKKNELEKQADAAR